MQIVIKRLDYRLQNHLEVNFNDISLSTFFHMLVIRFVGSFTDICSHTSSIFNEAEKKQFNWEANFICAGE